MNLAHLKGWRALPRHLGVTKRKKKSALGLVGLLIVFSTFLAKEVIRENLKDKIADIAGAQNIFLIRADNTDSGTNFSRLYEFTDSDSDARHKEEGDNLSDRQLQIDILDRYEKRRTFAYPALDDFRRTVDNLERLNNALPKSFRSEAEHVEWVKKRYLELKSELDKDAPDIENREAIAYVKMIGRLSTRQEKRDGRREWGRLAQELDDTDVPEELETTASEAHKIGDSELEAAEAAKKSIEFRYTISIWISAVLFAAGWGLNLYALLTDQVSEEGPCKID